MKTPFVRSLTILALMILPVRAIAAVEIQEVTSPGGITAWLVEEPWPYAKNIENQTENNRFPKPPDAGMKPTGAAGGWRTAARSSATGDLRR